MRKIFSIFLVFLLLCMSTTMVFAQKVDIFEEYEKISNSDLTIEIENGTSLVSVSNGSTDISEHVEFKSEDIQGVTIGKLTFEKDYLQSLNVGEYNVSITYNTSSQQNVKKTMSLSIMESELPTVTPSVAKYDGKDLVFDFTLGENSLRTNIINKVVHNGHELTSNDFSYSASEQKITIKDYYLSLQTGTIELYVIFDNLYNTSSKISVDCDYTPTEPEKPSIDADIITKFDFGLKLTTNTNYSKIYSLIRSDNNKFPYDEFLTQYGVGIMNLNGPINVMVEKDSINNAILKIYPNNAPSLTNYSFDVSFMKKATSESDFANIKGSIMSDPSSFKNVVRSYNDMNVSHIENFDNELANFTFNFYKERVVVKYTGLLNGEYKFNFDTALDFQFLNYHYGEIYSTEVDNFIFPDRQQFPGKISIAVKNFKEYKNPVIYKLNSDGSLSEMEDVTYNDVNNTFYFESTRLDYGYVIADKPIHNEYDKEVSDGYGGHSDDYEDDYEDENDEDNGNNNDDDNNNDNNNNDNNNNDNNNNDDNGNNNNNNNNNNDDDDDDDYRDRGRDKDKNKDKDKEKENPETGVVDFTPVIISIIVIVSSILFVVIKNNKE